MKKFLIFNLLMLIILISCNDKNDAPKELGKHVEEKEVKINNEFIKLSKASVKEIKLSFYDVSEGEIKGEIIAPAKLLTNPDNEAVVGSLIQGRVLKVNAKLGDNVKKGQTLMIIEGIEISEIKSQYLKNKAQLNYTESNFKRQKTLTEQNVGSQKSFLEAKSEYDKAFADFDAEHKKIHSIGLSDKEVENPSDAQDHSSGSLAIKSPINGVIIERNVIIGQLIESTTNAFRIINNSSICADAQIYEIDLSKISGKPDIKLTTTAYPNETFEGKVIYISEVVDKNTRTINIRAQLNNSNRKLKPDMFANMYIPISNSITVIVIPSEAIILENNESYVFIAVNDTTFQKRAVITGSKTEDFVEIKDGLKKGEKIVLDGTFYLKSELKKEELGGD